MFLIKRHALTDVALLRKYLFGQKCILCDYFEYIFIFLNMFLNVDVGQYFVENLQYVFFFSPSTSINACIMLLIVYFYYTIWMLEILAPLLFLSLAAIFFFVIKGKVISR